MKHTKIRRLAYLSILSAIILLMAFTPLGYLKVGIVSITFLPVAVVVGAIVLGPGGGAVLGGVFGLSSFLQCFGLDVFGTTLLQISFPCTMLLCFAPRIVMGWLSGLCFAALYRRDRTRLLSFAAASLAGAWLNTLLFVGTLVLCFGGSDYLRSFGDSVFAIVASLITVNTLVESAACLILGTAIGKAVYSLPFVWEVRR